MAASAPTHLLLLCIYAISALGFASGSSLCPPEPILFVTALQSQCPLHVTPSAPVEVSIISRPTFFSCVFCLGFLFWLTGSLEIVFVLRLVGWARALSLSLHLFFLWFLLDFPVFVDGLFGSHVCLKFGGVNGDGSISIF